MSEDSLTHSPVVSGSDLEPIELSESTVEHDAMTLTAALDTISRMEQLFTEQSYPGCNPCSATTGVSSTGSFVGSLISFMVKGGLSSVGCGFFAAAIACGAMFGCAESNERAHPTTTTKTELVDGAIDDITAAVDVISKRFNLASVEVVNTAIDKIHNATESSSASFFCQPSKADAVGSLKDAVCQLSRELNELARAAEINKAQRYANKVN